MFEKCRKSQNIKNVEISKSWKISENAKHYLKKTSNVSKSLENLKVSKILKKNREKSRKNIKHI